MRKRDGRMYEYVNIKEIKNYVWIAYLKMTENLLEIVSQLLMDLYYAP